jgi:nitrogen fixation-related uncharacterized protein
MSKKTIFLMAGVAFVGYFWWKNKGQFENKVRKTARTLRRGLDPIEERVTGGLEDLARTIQDVNRKVKVVSGMVDAALGRIA